jgi:hypothetical protein
MLRLRRLRRDISFSGRVYMDSMLQPWMEGGDVRIAYPDAFWHARQDDIDRAIRVAEVEHWRTNGMN